jgi:hypothetical protein
LGSAMANKEGQAKKNTASRNRRRSRTHLVDA